MKIVTYEIPFTITRVGSSVKLELDEDNKKEVASEALQDQRISNIPNIAKELADENDKQKTLVKHTLLGKDERSEGKITLKYLV